VTALAPRKGRVIRMENGTIAFAVAGVVIVGIALWYISTMNRFARLNIKIEESDSGIDVALTKRYDTLTKMLDVTKGYAKHEAETLTNIVKMRKGMSMDERSEASRQMDEMTGKINVLAESYPDLKASENFKQLQIAVADVEEHLQAARRVYNMNVSAFNQLLASWPSSVVGNVKGHAPKEFFEAETKKKEDVKMEF
jgi:LemA protein